MAHAPSLRCCLLSHFQTSESTILSVFPHFPLQIKTKVLLMVLRSVRVMACHYHSGFTAFNLFLHLSLWLFLSQEAKDYSDTPRLSCIADMKSQKDTSLYAIPQTPHPWFIRKIRLELRTLYKTLDEFFSTLTVMGGKG